MQASEKRLKEILQTIYLFAQMQTNPANLGACLLTQPNASYNLSQCMGQVNVFTVCWLVVSKDILQRNYSSGMQRTIKIFHNQAIGERNRLNDKLSRASSINWFNPVELQRLYFFGFKTFWKCTGGTLDHTEVHK